MENWRGGNGRKGQPHNNSAGSNKKDQAPIGFEGMNYEQKRKPYGEGRSLEIDVNRDTANETNVGKRRGDL